MTHKELLLVFSEKDIEAKLVANILQAANRLALPKDCQTWHYMLLKEHKLKKMLIEAEVRARKNEDGFSLKSMRTALEGAINAPMFLVILADQKLDELTKKTLALNALLECAKSNLEPLWLGNAFEDPEVVDRFRKETNTPKKWMPDTVLVLGYLAVTRVQPLPLQKKNIHYERW